MKIFFLTLLVTICSTVHAKVWTFGILGDAGAWNQETAMVQRSLLKSQVKDLILPGDNLYNTQLHYGDIWDHWVNQGFHFPVVAIGNHRRTFEEEVSYFKMPAQFYSKIIGDARFIVLNSDNNENIREQADFLESELYLARENFIFVVFHHSPYTLTKRHTWEERKSFQLAIRPVLLQHRHNITAVLVGHDHIASLYEFAGIPLVVSGAVWESLPSTAVSYQDGDVNVLSHWVFKSGFYWTRLDLDDQSKEAWVNFVRVDKDEVSCSIRIAPKPILLRPNCRLN